MISKILKWLESVTTKDDCCDKAVKVKIVGNDSKDPETVIKCDINTGNSILIIALIDQDGVPIITYYDLVTGAPYAGNPATDLVECPDSELESDSKVMCDNGTTSFLRWFVKKDGEPTGITFDTDFSGATYNPVGPVTSGECDLSNTMIHSFIDVGDGTYTSPEGAKTIIVTYDAYRDGFDDSATNINVLVTGASVGNQAYTVIPNTSRTITVNRGDLVSVTISNAVSNTVEVTFLK